MNNQIELSHICLVFLTDFIKQHKEYFEPDKTGRVKFLKLNADKRIKLINETLDTLTPSAREQKFI